VVLVAAVALLTFGVAIAAYIKPSLLLHRPALLFRVSLGG
jgi:hypothetical protein